MKAVVIAATILMLAATAYAEGDRDAMIDRVEAIGQVRKIAERGRAADDRVIANGRLNDKALGSVGATVDDVITDVEDYKRRSDWTGAIVAGVGGLLGISGIGLFARSRIKAAQNLAAQTLQGVANVVQPAAEPVQPFLGAPPAGYPSREGDRVDRAESGGGSGSADDPRGMTTPAPVLEAASLPSGEWDLAGILRQQRRGGNGNGSH